MASLVQITLMAQVEVFCVVVGYQWFRCPCCLSSEDGHHHCESFKAHTLMVFL